jgi:hypothetical protein
MPLLVAESFKLNPKYAPVWAKLENVYSGIGDCKKTRGAYWKAVGIATGF